MKRIVLLILILFLFPMSVFARQETKENLIKAIQDIKNVQVDDDIIIKETEVTENTIEFHIEKNNEQAIEKVEYYFDGVCFLFSSGYIENQNIISNEAAFYLYSILESLSTAPYDSTYYYNNQFIKSKINELENREEQSYYDIGKTFGLHLIHKEDKILIEYQYYLDGEDTILTNPIVEARKEDILTNPETGNFSFFVTVLFLIVVGLASYTYINPKKESLK